MPRMHFLVFIILPIILMAQLIGPEVARLTISRLKNYQRARRPISRYPRTPQIIFAGNVSPYRLAWFGLVVAKF